jgi:hypothetical protein
MFAPGTLFSLIFFVFSSNFVLKFCFLVWFLALSLQLCVFHFFRFSAIHTSGPVHKMLVLN